MNIDKAKVFTSWDNLCTMVFDDLVKFIHNLLIDGKLTKKELAELLGISVEDLDKLLYNELPDIKLETYLLVLVLNSLTLDIHSIKEPYDHSSSKSKYGNIEKETTMQFDEKLLKKDFAKLLDISIDDLNKILYDHSSGKSKYDNIEKELHEKKNEFLDTLNQCKPDSKYLQQLRELAKANVGNEKLCKLISYYTKIDNMATFQEIAFDYVKSYTDKSRIYFIEKYLSTYDENKRKNVPLILFPKQKELLYSIGDFSKTIAKKPRRAGMTTILSAWATAEMVFTHTDSPKTILCVGFKLELANQLVAKIRRFLLQVPRWYFGFDYYSPDPNSKKNTKDIFIKDEKSELQLFNGSQVVAMPSSKISSKEISEASIVIFDEAAFIEDGAKVYNTLKFGEVPSCYGDYQKIIIASTPNGKDKLFYKTYKKALHKKNSFNVVDFKWFEDPRYNKKLKWKSKSGDLLIDDWFFEDTFDRIDYFKFIEKIWNNLLKNGWKPTSPWYKNMCRLFNNDAKNIAEELNACFIKAK